MLKLNSLSIFKIRFSKRFLYIFSSVIILFSNFITINHHHEDAEPHYDCPVCILSINQQSNNPEELINDFKIYIEKPDYQYNYTSPTLQLILNIPINPRAPPVSPLYL